MTALRLVKEHQAARERDRYDVPTDEVVSQCHEIGWIIKQSDSLKGTMSSALSVHSGYIYLLLPRLPKLPGPFQ